jgi:hypothetical protein
MSRVKESTMQSNLDKLVALTTAGIIAQVKPCISLNLLGYSLGVIEAADRAKIF